MTLIFGIIGDPIAQARSPLVFNRLFKRQAVDATMIAMHVAAPGLERALSGLRGMQNLGGLIVTVPHKLAAARISRPCSERVRVTQAINALRPCPDGWEGDLFDGEGFAEGLEMQGITAAGHTCAIVGAGGAGSAIALALLQRGVASLKLWDADHARAESLAAGLARAFPAHISLGPPDSRTEIAINATPLGMKDDDPLPMDVSLLPAGAIVAEIVMTPPMTNLLRVARRRGLTIHRGRHMLDGQVGLIWAFFGLPDLTSRPDRC